jgi:hypothetical protein
VTVADWGLTAQYLGAENFICDTCLNFGTALTHPVRRSSLDHAGFKMYHLRRLTITAFVLSAIVFILWLLPRVLNPTPPNAAERLRDQRWVQSSPYWVDRQACRFLGLCGVHHVRWDAPALPNNDTRQDKPGDLRKRLDDPYADIEEAAAWERARRRQRGWRRDTSVREGKRRNDTLREIPDYVLQYAPLVHLYSGENFWPANIAEHIKHMRPVENGTALNVSQPLTLANLGVLNKQPLPVYLTSEVDIETRPEWLHSHMGIPTVSSGSGGRSEERPDSLTDLEDDAALRMGEGSTWFDVDREHPIHRVSDPRRLEKQQRPLFSNEKPTAAAPRSVLNRPEAQAFGGHKPDHEGYSQAPAVLVMVDKGSGILDAFWFFFYSYNLGQTVLDIRFGNHVGDWEHCMVRFEAGIPRAMFLSEHAGGKAFAWQALEKRRTQSDITGGEAILPERPVIYSAVGSHAMYATPGLHPYVLPFKMLADATDRGPLWDPVLNNMAYWYDYEMDGDIEPEVVGPAAAAEALDEALSGNASTVPMADWTSIFAATFDQAAPVAPIEDAVPCAQLIETAVTDSSTDAQEEGPTALTPAASNPDAPTSWFFFAGPWGDALYPLSDPRQWRLFGQYHYHTGPLGPRWKNLARHRVCQTERCRILWSLEEEKTASWYS